MRAARLEGGRGYAGGQHDLHFERGVLRRLRNVAHARHAADVRDLVRVGDDLRGTVRQDEPRELLGRKLRAFDVHVRVDQPRRRDPAADVDLFLPAVCADADDLAVRDRNIALLHFSREYVDVAPVLQNKLRALLPERGGNTLCKHCIPLLFSAIIPHLQKKASPAPKARGKTFIFSEVFSAARQPRRSYPRRRTRSGGNSPARSSRTRSRECRRRSPLRGGSRKTSSYRQTRGSAATRTANFCRPCTGCPNRRGSPKAALRSCGRQRGFRRSVFPLRA